MFEKESDMMSAKSAGSPAFLPPELCVAKHGAVSGTAADIWSMGVTLYCLRYGRIPFEVNGVLEMYEAIRENEVDYTPVEKEDPQFVNLMHRILEKDPAKRIKMDELRVSNQLISLLDYMLIIIGTSLGDQRPHRPAPLEGREYPNAC